MLPGHWGAPKIVRRKYKKRKIQSDHVFFASSYKNKKPFTMAKHSTILLFQCRSKVERQTDDIKESCNAIPRQTKERQFQNIGRQA